MSVERVKELYGKNEPDLVKFVPPSPKNKVRLRNDTLYIYVEHNLVTIGVVKGLTKRKYHKEPRPHWTAPLTLGNVLDLQAAKFTLCEKTQAWVDKTFSTPVIDPDLVIPGLTHPLLPYQTEGVQWIDHWSGRTLLADDPGLGKSVQAIAWGLWREKSPTLILCPAFLKFNWEDEIKFWANKTSIQVIEGLQETEIWGEYVIANYDVLSWDEGGEVFLRDDLAEVDWQYLIIDECHYISNPTALRTLAVKAIALDIPHIVPASATPGKSRPAELFTAINLVNNKIFPSFLKYGHRYCGPKQVKGQWEFKGASNEYELHDLLTSTVMLRRKKRDVFKDLPAKRRIPVLLSGGLDEQYREEEKKERTSFFEFEALKQEAVRIKMPSMISWIHGMLASEDKLVIYAEHKETVDALMEEFGDITVKVDGRVTSKAKRREAVLAFQRCKQCGVKKEFHGRDPEACTEYQVDLSTRIFIGTRAAKEGGTLTATDHVIFTELWWSMDDHEQGEDRAYGRAGDMHGATAWYLILKGSVEEEIADIISLKDRRMSKVKDGKHPHPDMVLNDLIKRYKGN